MRGKRVGNEVRTAGKRVVDGGKRLGMGEEAGDGGGAVKKDDVWGFLGFYYLCSIYMNLWRFCDDRFALKGV